MRIYNTLKREKEELKIIDEKNNIVNIYTCGPTVYNFAHIGNMRAYIFMDVLRKVLKFNGYKLNHVMNITDVGHLTSDADEGEDKMMKSARLQNKTVYEIADMYTKKFMEDIKKLNIEEPEHVAKATDHIREMEEYVNKIYDNGYAYETSTGIYFDTSKLPTYGELSRAKLEENIAGARVEVDVEKRNPSDFALWIKAPKEHIMKWNSRWGECYPGWHIECSAMSKKYLGEVFDIHTGGVDHIPIHHENEIAQSRGATGKNLSNYWMHVEFLLINDGKMSKSLNNVYTLENLGKKNIEPLAFRYFTFTSHYRNKLNFTWEGITSCQIALNKLRQSCNLHKGVNVKIDNKKLEELEEKFKNAINDDINMPHAMATVWEVAKEQEKSNDYYSLLKKFDEVLSIDIDNIVEDNNEVNINELSEDVKNILENRAIARTNKDFASSDMLREQLKEKGFVVIDSKEGQKLEKIGDETCQY